MTRAEEAAKRAYPTKIEELHYSDHIEMNGGLTEIDVNGFPRIYFQKGYEQAEKDIGWINVKDRLPEKDTVVLTCWDVNGVPQGIGLRLYDGQWQDFDEDDDIEISDPDYWMPIPQFNK